MKFADQKMSLWIDTSQQKYGRKWIICYPAGFMWICLKIERIYLSEKKFARQGQNCSLGTPVLTEYIVPFLNIHKMQLLNIIRLSCFTML